MLRLRKPYALLLIILTVIAVYYSAIFAEVLSVDDKKMIDNLLVRDEFNLKGLFFPGGAYYYRPLLYLTFITDKFVWGAHESFMHLENVVIHAFNACLVYLLTVKISVLNDNRSSGTSLAAALLFALHPIATEPINWISGRTDLMAGLFVLTAFYFLFESIENKRFLPLTISAVAFFLAPLAKETAIFWYPGAIFLVYVVTRSKDVAFPADVLKSVLSYRRYYLVLSAVPFSYFILRHFALKTYDSGVKLAIKGIVSTQDFDFFNKLRVSFKILGFYFKKLVVPTPLNFTITHVSSWYLYLGVIGIIFFLYFCYRRDILSALLIMAVGILSPALLVPFGKMALTPVAERYLYMPSAFFVISAIVFGERYLREGSVIKTVQILLFPLILASGYTTYARNIVWQKNLTLFQDCVKQNPDYAIVRNELATALRNEGRHAEADEIYMNNKISSDQKYSLVTEINKAMTLCKNGYLSEADKLLRSLNSSASNPFYRNYLQAKISVNEKLLEKTLDMKQQQNLMYENLELMIQYQKVTGDPYGYYAIGKLAITAGKKQTAIEYFKLAYERSPANSFYKVPAKRLFERLSQETEGSSP